MTFPGFTAASSLFPTSRHRAHLSEQIGEQWITPQLEDRFGGFKDASGDTPFGDGSDGSDDSGSWGADGGGSSDDDDLPPLPTWDSCITRCNSNLSACNLDCAINHSGFFDKLFGWDRSCYSGCFQNYQGCTGPCGPPPS
jgi:hypothetical protein